MLGDIQRPVTSRQTKAALAMQDMGDVTIELQSRYRDARPARDEIAFDANGLRTMDFP